MISFIFGCLCFLLILWACLTCGDGGVVEVNEIKKSIIRDLENMEEITERLADRSDIWQDRFIYWMAVAIRDILLWIVKKG